MQRYIWKSGPITYPVADTVTIHFDTNGQDLTYLPGQYINISVPVNGQQVQRSYSLSSSPYLDERPAITIKRVEGGLVSNYLVDHAHEITEWEITGPFGVFAVDEACLAKEQVFLIGGGSGITPLFSIAKSLLWRSAATVSIIYASRDQENTLFFPELNLLEAAFPDRLQVYYAFSRHDQQQEADCRKYLNERLNRLLLKKIIRQLGGASEIGQAAWFSCGPAGLITLSEEVLKDLGIPEQQLRKEHFWVDIPSAPVLPEVTNEVLLHFYERTNLLEVTPGSTILDIALAEGIPLSYSCRGGTCGRCVGKLENGKVHMNANYALGEELLDAGYILLCQCYPLDNEVTIIIDE